MESSECMVFSGKGVAARCGTLSFHDMRRPCQESHPGGACVELPQRLPSSRNCSKRVLDACQRQNRVRCAAAARVLPELHVWLNGQPMAGMDLVVDFDFIFVAMPEVALMRQQAVAEGRAQLVFWPLCPRSRPYQARADVAAHIGDRGGRRTKLQEHAYTTIRGSLRLPELAAGDRVSSGSMMLRAAGEAHKAAGVAPAASCSFQGRPC